MRQSRLLPVVLVALVAAGCGGGGRAGKPAPVLPGTLARSLATRADSVAAQLDADDPCAARERALDLQQAAIAAINERRIPAAYQEPLLGDITLLLQRIRCNPEPAPAPVPTTTSEAPPAPPFHIPPGQAKKHGGEGHGHGKGDKPGKGRKD